MRCGNIFKQNVKQRCHKQINGETNDQTTSPQKTYKDGKNNQTTWPQQNITVTKIIKQRGRHHHRAHPRSSIAVAASVAA